jgi:hypothetical protein
VAIAINKFFFIKIECLFCYLSFRVFYKNNASKALKIIQFAKVRIFFEKNKYLTKNTTKKGK